jgi:hypothetical protein
VNDKKVAFCEVDGKDAQDVAVGLCPAVLCWDRADSKRVVAAVVGEASAVGLGDSGWDLGVAWRLLVAGAGW